MSIAFRNYSWLAHRQARVSTWATPLVGLAVVAALLGLAGPAAAQTQLQRNPLPKAYRGTPPGTATAQPSPVARVDIRVVDAEGRALAKALVRVEGASQQLWADEAGALQLLVNLDRGPLRLTCSCFGYDDAQLSIARPEDNNLIFQLLRSKAVAAAKPRR